MSFTADFGLLQFSLKSLIVWLTVKWIILSTLKLLCSVLSTLVTVTLKYSFLRPHSQENKFHQKEGLGCNCFISYLWCIRHIYCQVLFIIQKKIEMKHSQSNWIKCNTDMPITQFLVFHKPLITKDAQ